jgi:hypothetical protein
MRQAGLGTALWLEEDMTQDKTKEKEKPGTLSSGMRQKMIIAKGFIIRTPIFFMDELKGIKSHFRQKQYIIYILGSLFILVSLSLSYFLYFHGTFWLAISVFIAFNGIATYFLYKASKIVQERDWRE